jgi:hypothetical protein
MLIAAMVLGLIGGITYFVGGGMGAIVHTGADSAQWWVIALIVIGAVAIIGAALVRMNPGLGGSILLLAGAAAISVGFASYKEAVSVSQLNFSLVFPEHPFAGPFIYLPVPLLSLVVGGALALAAGKKSDAN